MATLIIPPTDGYEYSAPSSLQTQEVQAEAMDSIEGFSAPSDVQSIEVVAIVFALRFLSKPAEYKNERTVASSFEIYDTASGLVSTDPSDVFEYSLVESGGADAWVNIGTSTSFQIDNPDISVSAGQMMRTYTLRVRATRGGEAVGAELVWSFNIDEVKPVTTCDVSSGTYAASTKTIHLNASDWSEIVATYYNVNSPTPPDQTSTLYTGAIVVSDATNIVRFFSVDRAGNIEAPNWSGDENTVHITLDVASPVITIDNTTDTNLGVGEVCEVTWHVNEHCTRVDIVKGGDGSFGTGETLVSLVDVAAGTPHINSIPFSSLSVGMTTIYLIAQDDVSNVGFTSFEILYDTQIPVITIYEVFRHVLARDEQVTLVWKSSLGGSYVVNIGGVAFTTGDVVAGAVMETVIPANNLVANVANQVAIYVTTLAGNSGSNSTDVTVDTLAPRTRLSKYGSEGPFSSSFILTIYATDDAVVGIPTDMGLLTRGRVDIGKKPRATIRGMVTGAESGQITIGSDSYGVPSALQTNEVTAGGEASSIVISGETYGPPAVPPQVVEIFVAPIAISDVHFGVATTTAQVMWTTARSADSKVIYSLDPSFATGVYEVYDAALTTSHAVNLPGTNPALTESTRYYFKVVSAVDGHEEEDAGDPPYSFLTNAAVDSIAPTISNLRATSSGSDSIVVDWQTDELANTNLIMGQQPDLSDGVLQSVADIAGVLNHSYAVTGLAASTRYYFKAVSIDMASNEAISSEIVDALTWSTSAPAISNETVSAYRTVCVLRWQTDVPSTASVSYGTTNGYGYSATAIISGLRTEHEVILTGLTPERLYHYNLNSVDEFGNAVGVVDKTFTTLANRDTRVAIYATTDGSPVSVSHWGYRSVGGSGQLQININGTTPLNYMATDGYYNATVPQEELYSFDSTACVITFESIDPVLIGLNWASTVRFKTDEVTNYEITNHVGTVLASGVTEADVWLNAIVHSADMIEGINHLTIRAWDAFDNTTSLEIGHIIRDTTAPVVEPSLVGGYYNHTLSIDLIPTVTRSGENVIIYYTTDGSIPTPGAPGTNSAANQVNDIIIETTTGLRWFGVDDVGNREPVKFARYIIDTVRPTITASPLPGTYDEVVSVTLSASEPATIYYTTDESAPTEESAIYVAPIQVIQDTRIRCFAKDLAGNLSEEYVFIYEIQVLYDKKFKKVIGFQDKYLLETEFNESQDIANRRLEELSREVIGSACIAQGLDIMISPDSFEFFIGRGKAYIGGKFVTVVRRDQDFIPPPQAGDETKVFHIILTAHEPVFRPARPGQPGWEVGVPEITTYRLEESYRLLVVEQLPDNEPYMELYEVTRPATATNLSQCTVVDKRHFFEPLCNFQRKTNQEIAELQANLIALGLEVESYKLRNLLGLKNAFVDTFENTGDVDMSRSSGFRYVNTRFEL